VLASPHHYEAEEVAAEESQGSGFGEARSAVTYHRAEFDRELIRERETWIDHDVRITVVRIPPSPP
jgi:hypothetical protein